MCTHTHLHCTCIVKGMHDGTKSGTVCLAKNLISCTTNKKGVPIAMRSKAEKLKFPSLLEQEFGETKIKHKIANTHPSKLCTQRYIQYTHIHSILT